MLWEDLLQRPFCIYGAGIVATSIYTAFRRLYNRVPLFFLVSDEEESSTRAGKRTGYSQAGVPGENPREIDGIPVMSFSEWEKKYCKKMRENPEAAADEFTQRIPEIYIVAVPEMHHASILEMLKQLPVKGENIFRITNQLENDLMEKFYGRLPGCDTVRNILAREGRGSLRGQDRSQANLSGQAGSDSQINNGGMTGSGSLDAIHVYQANSHRDKPLQKKQNLLNFPSYICPIQVGAILTDRKIAELQDHIGDNISAKNNNYCELTAAYYAWKHNTAPYKGLCHYRRFFDISDEQMQALLQAGNEWEVILPYPSVHYPNISAQHSRYLSEEDWSAMLQALGELEPEYLEAYEKSVAAGEQLFHNFNMLIAKAAVFDDYCRFLFRVLERTEELTTPKGWERADRFAGYMGENLTTLYFLKNRARWKQVYAGKIWLV